MSEQEKVNILLVDDQPSRLLSYDVILGSLGQNLVHARSGTEALERLMKDEFALILLDVSMPEMDGFETAELIHRHPRFEETPIIFVTALHVTDMDRLRGYQLGAVDYVYVPVVPEILRSKVLVLVELYSKRRELERVNRTLEQANAELALANSTLQAEQNRTLQALNRTLEQANADLALTNANLQAEVAERERLEQALRETDRRKDAFLAMLAHELRNPLAPIANAVELISLNQTDDPQLLWCRAVLSRQVEHLTRLIEDLLDVSRITQGKINLERAPVSLADIVGRAIETTRPLIDARAHALTIELPPEPLYVDGDPTRLAQVVGNLLNNAAKYTPQGGNIQLSVQRDGQRKGSGHDVLISVRDDGAGISGEMLPRVFDLFTQAETTVDRSQGGLGIGLALVQRLVEMHGGTVTVESEGEGRGCEFRVRLPLLERQQASMLEPLRAGRAAIQTPSLRILVADDNIDSALSLALLLQSAGNKVESVHDGVEAVAAAERFKPDVVLLDIGMPKLDGYGAAQRIRALPEGKDIMLIALTGWGQEETRDRTRAAGFDAHLVKPLDFSALFELLADP